jgi:hypothetical protein
MHKIGTAILASTIFIGPIAGAVLPFLAVGFGVYWLVRRRRKANGPAAPMRAEAAEVAAPTCARFGTSTVPTKRMAAIPHAAYRWVEGPQAPLKLGTAIAPSLPQRMRVPNDGIVASSGQSPILTALVAAVLAHRSRTTHGPMPAHTAERHRADWFLILGHAGKLRTDREQHQSDPSCSVGRNTPDAAGVGVPKPIPCATSSEVHTMEQIHG